MTQETIKDMYLNHFNGKNGNGYRVDVEPVNKGFLAIEKYQRNKYSEEIQTRTVLFSRGRVFEDHQKIGEYCYAN